jgi:hypothetical protein
MTPTRIVSLLPTFARPWLALSAIKMWLDQTHPLRDRHLVVGCDDDDPAAFNLPRLRDAILYDHSQEAANHVHMLKLPASLSLPEKYNRMAGYAFTFPCPNADLVTVWEDDDLYLPAHLDRIASCWNRRNRPQHWWGHPRLVWSDYTGHIEVEPAAGRFHAALAMTPSMLDLVDWWPVTKQPDFDQQLLGRLAKTKQPAGQYDLRQSGSNVSAAPTFAHPTYVFLWHTGSTHGQHTMDAGLEWQAQAKARLLQELAVRPWDLVIQLQQRASSLRNRMTFNGEHPQGPLVELTQAGIAAARIQGYGAVPRVG